MAGEVVSDKYIVENSGYLEHLSPGDVVLVDRGFDVDDSLALYGAILNIPAYTRGHDQLPADDVEATRKLANVQIHVERIIVLFANAFRSFLLLECFQKSWLKRKQMENFC